MSVYILTDSSHLSLDNVGVNNNPAPAGHHSWRAAVQALMDFHDKIRAYLCQDKRADV